MKKIYQLACIAMAALVLIGGCKDEEHQPLPADAGTISGATENACPEKTVALSINAVAEATAYVWYRNGEVIADASGMSYTVTESGSYTVAGNNTEGMGKTSPVHVVNIKLCPGEDGAVPADAGAITGPEVNDCPSRTAALSVEPITGATSYQWSIAYAEDDIETAITTEPAYTADFSNLFGENQAVTYTVSGVNDAGLGKASPPHVVTKQACVPEKPVILGNPDWIESTDNNLTVYRTVCPATNMAGTATSASEDVTRYQWYWQLVGTDPELKEWDTYGGAELTLGGRGYTYNFAVVAINADGESPRSDVIQVIGSSCFQPNRPGGVGGNVAIFPTAAGFYPAGPDYNVALSNCDIQEVTGTIETGVELTCNAAVATDADYPVLNYSFWVKTTADGAFTKVFTSTGTSGSARTLVVDGVTYPSGTYQVTAASADGDSEFGNNYVAVTIRTDCPEPPAPELAAPTFSSRRGGSYSNGTFTNNCGTATITLDINIPGTPAGNLTTITWKRHPGMEIARDGNEGTRTAWAMADNGTYTVTYTKEISGVAHESLGAEIVVALKLCTPTFATKPTAIVPPDTYAVAVINASDAVSEPVITSYEWYFNGAPATSAEVTAATATRTYHLFEPGTYTVRAKSTYGDSPFSEEIVLTGSSTPPASTYTRNELIGTYSVVDYKPEYPNGFVQKNYTLTIAAGTGTDDITITGLGDAPSVTLNATVSTSDNTTSLSIPPVNSRFSKVTSFDYESGIPNCSTDPLIVPITTVGGAPGVSQSLLLYVLRSTGNGNACGEIYVMGSTNSSDISSWTKQ
jgi:hypothetical protein